MAVAKTRKTIAVVMCTYMGQEYLGQQLDSLMSQTLLPDRIYIYDDLSSDATPGIIESYHQNFPEIIRPLADGVHRGINGAIWYSLSQTVEDLVFLCDQDDIWRPDKIRRMAEYAESRGEWDRFPCILHSESMLYQDCRDTGTVLSQLIGQRTTEPSVEDLLSHNLVQGCTMLINRPLIQLFCRKQPDAYFPHCMFDHWMALIAAAFGRIWFLEESLISYRIHGKNAVGSMQVNIYEKYALSRNRKIACEFLEIFMDLLSPEIADRIRFWIRKGYRKPSIQYLPLLARKGAMALCLGIKNH